MISGSELEFTAPRVPKEVAFELAREHFVFCSDNVLQNSGTIGRLADELIKSIMVFPVGLRRYYGG